MDPARIAQEIIGTYHKHGWQLRRVLLQTETQTKLESEKTWLPEVEPEPSEFDGLWFSRPSFNQREAWELRLLAETPFALFETFEPDETEEQREEMREEMEARMRDYAGKKE